MRTIFDNIKEVCEKKNISIRALERESGLGNGTIARWEVSSPNVTSLAKVADALDVTVSQLMKR